jgi:hypothetical protein
MTYLERFKAAFSQLGVVAGAYLPKDFKGAMIDLAGEVDQLRLEIQKLKEKGITNE